MAAADVPNKISSLRVVCVCVCVCVCLQKKSGHYYLHLHSTFYYILPSMLTHHQRGDGMVVNIEADLPHFHEGQSIEVVRINVVISNKG